MPSDFSTVSAIEVIWVGVTGCGVLLTSLLLRQAAKNRDALRELKINSAREYAAQTQVLRERGRLTTQILLTAPGVMAMTSPDSPLPMTLTRWISISSLMLATVAITGLALFDFYRFEKVLSMIDKRMREDADTLGVAHAELESDQKELKFDQRQLKVDRARLEHDRSEPQ